MRKATESDADALLAVPLDTIVGQHPPASRHPRPVDVKRLDAQVDELEDEIGRSPTEAYRKAVHLGRDWAAKVPTRRRKLCLDGYAATAARRSRWDLLDKGFDLRHRSGCMDLEAVWSMEIAACRAATEARLFGAAQQHAATALAMSPRDGYGIRFHLMSLLMLNGWDASAEDLAKAYDHAGDDEKPYRNKVPAIDRRRRPWHEAFAAMRDGASSWRVLVTEAVRRDPDVAGWILKDNPDTLSPGEDYEAMSITRPMLIAWKAKPEAMNEVRSAFGKMEEEELARLGGTFAKAWQKAVRHLSLGWDAPFPRPLTLAFLARRLHDPRKTDPDAAGAARHAIACRDLLERDHPAAAATLAGMAMPGPFRRMT